jgi:hypothetical protein
MLFIGLFLACGAILLSARIGTRSALPFVGICTCGLLFFENQQSLSIAPLLGWLVVFGLEQEQTYGRLMALSLLPGLIGAFIFNPPYGTEEMIGQFRIIAGDGVDPRALTELVFRLWPAIALLEYILMFLWGYRLAFVLAPRLGLALPSALGIARWRPWEELIWVAIVALVLSVLDVELLSGLSLNLAVIMTIVYAAQGFGVAVFFTDVLVTRLKVVSLFGRMFLKWFPLWFFFLTGFWVCLVIVGLLDTWFDWRKLKPQQPDTADAQ